MVRIPCSMVRMSTSLSTSTSKEGRQKKVVYMPDGSCLHSRCNCCRKTVKVHVVCIPDGLCLCYGCNCCLKEAARVHFVDFPNNCCLQNGRANENHGNESAQRRRRHDHVSVTNPVLLRDLKATLATRMSEEPPLALLKNACRRPDSSQKT